MSSERTKMNYIVSMVAEDLIGYGNSLVNVNPKTTQVQLDEYRRPVENGVISSVKNIHRILLGTNIKLVHAMIITKNSRNLVKIQKL